MNKHTAVYVRVSTTTQDHRSQMPDLERWAAAHDGPVEWYRDTFTGRDMNRPEMNKLMDDMRAGKLDRIVVWRLDRLGRTARGLCELYDDLIERSVGLVSIRDGFSLDTASGRLHARILASVAEFENEVRSERIRAGQAAARARGKVWGGSTPGRVSARIESKSGAAHALVAAGCSITEVSRTLEISRPTVYKILRDRNGHPDPNPAP